MSDIILLADTDFEVKSLFKNIYSVVMDCAEHGDIDTLVSNMVGLKNVHERSGVALAWMWYKLKNVWHLFDIGDSFEDTISSRTGYNVEVIRRYVRVAEMLDSAPEEVLDSLSEKGIKALIPVANAYAGYYFSEEDWGQIAQSDPHDIPEYVRENIRHAEPRTGSIRIYMDRMGSLWVYCDNDERKFIGNLEIEIAKEEPAVKKAIDRIINSSGIRVE